MENITDPGSGGKFGQAIEGKGLKLGISPQFFCLPSLFRGGLRLKSISPRRSRKIADGKGRYPTAFGCRRTKFAIFLSLLN
jgi:hypothetical protein